MAIESINPATEEIMERFEELDGSEIEAALAGALSAFESWRRRPLDQRGALMSAAATELRRDKDRLARLITLEMGKPITEAEAEVEKCAWCCEHYAANTASYLADQPHASSATESYVAFDPLGPVLAIMPWNFPFWQVFRFAAPALMAGNTALLKHSSNVPSCSLEIAAVFRRAGFPEGVFQSLLVGSAAVERLIADDRVRAVTLTGSDVTGGKVAAAAGKALKKTVLELGGSDPFVVLADADIEKAVGVAVTARNQNSGQSCIAAKRFIVEAAVADEFEGRFAAAVQALHMGDPLQRETRVGPLARGDLREDLASQVERSVSAGARVATGGRAPQGRGYFFTPTVLTAVAAGMPAFREETFGPVAAVIRAVDAATAVRLANDTPFGLGASLWTRDIERARHLARDIEAGSVFINGMVASDPRLPFGGIKRSGYGRELSEYGIREFVNVKTVWIGPAKTEIKAAD
jgi:succinate-semialdehyde dehydrogenase/glutarate-semialdehyde dehydrogenase